MLPDVFRSFFCCHCEDSSNGMPHENTVPMLDEGLPNLQVPDNEKPHVESSLSKEVGKFGFTEAKAEDIAEQVQAQQLQSENGGMHVSWKIGSEEQSDAQVWEVCCSKEFKDEELGLSMMIDRHGQLSLSADPSQPGAVLRWNSDHPDQAVAAGDIVESVNGCESKKDILEAMKDSCELTFRMRRVIRCEVIVPCSSEGNLGLELRESGSALMVERILEAGDVKRANARCDAGKQIVVGNLIVKVNGVGGDAHDMVQRLQTARGNVSLAIYRPF